MVGMEKINKGQVAPGILLPILIEQLLYKYCNNYSIRIIQVIEVLLHFKVKAVCPGNVSYIFDKWHERERVLHKEHLQGYEEIKWGLEGTWCCPSAKRKGPIVNVKLVHLRLACAPKPPPPSPHPSFTTVVCREDGRLPTRNLAHYWQL